MIRERDVEAYLKKRVEEKGVKIRKARWIGRRGAPDRRILGHCWVEVKAPDGRLDGHQIREIADMRLAGEIVEVVYSFHDVDCLVERYL